MLPNGMPNCQIVFLLDRNMAKGLKCLISGLNLLVDSKDNNS